MMEKHVLTRGNYDHFAGEVLVYAKQVSEDGKLWYPAVFFASDRERLQRFYSRRELRQGTLKEEKGRYSCAFFPSGFLSFQRLTDVDILNVFYTETFTQPDDLMGEKLYSIGIGSYLPAYYQQIKAQYNIDFFNAKQYGVTPEPFSSVLSLLVDKMVEGLDKGINHGEPHQAEAAASLIRLMSDEKRGYYTDAVAMAHGAFRQDVSLNSRAEHVFLVRDKMIAVAREEYEKADELKAIIHGREEEAAINSMWKA